MGNKQARGTPTPLLLSAQQWRWEHVSGPFTIDLRIAGDLVVNETTSKLNTVEFDIAKDIDVRIDFGAIMKAMFSQSVYPGLEENQVFSISDLLVDKGNNTLTIVGNVLEKLS